MLNGKVIQIERYIGHGRVVTDRSHHRFWIVEMGCIYKPINASTVYIVYVNRILNFYSKQFLFEHPQFLFKTVRIYLSLHFSSSIWSPLTFAPMFILTSKQQIWRLKNSKLQKMYEKKTFQDESDPSLCMDKLKYARLNLIIMII